jgi:hypothetical protein
MGRENNIAQISFVESWAQDGLSEDGLPAFVPIVEIHKVVGNNTAVKYVATDQDRMDFADEWREFEKTRLARNTTGVKGYPLVLWPAIGPADLAMCLVRDIITVEQLAPLAMQEGVPAPIRELAHRAKRLVEMQAKTGKYEALVEQLRAERDQLAEQLREANAMLSAFSAFRAMMPQQPQPPVA